MLVGGAFYLMGYVRINNFLVECASSGVSKGERRIVEEEEA